MLIDIEELKKQIKRNCTISDARFWGYYSICGLLMRLRELYRSERSLIPWEAIHREEVAEWIASVEKEWKSLEHEDLRPLRIDGELYDPFDVDGINTLLNPLGLLYGGGYGRFSKPTFFLAALEKKRELYDYVIHYSGKELCRDLSTSVAMLQGRCIFIRLDAVNTLLWDKFQELRARKSGGLLTEAFSSVGVDGLSSLEELYVRINSLSREVSELFVRHEMGEAYEDEHSEAWLDILSRNSDRVTEFYVRGVKDLLADTSEMGPLKYVVGKKDRSLLYFNMVFMDGIRKELFPEILTAFQGFTEDGGWSSIEEARRLGYEKARDLREHIVGLWRESKTEGLGSFVRQYLKGPEGR